MNKSQMTKEEVFVVESQETAQQIGGIPEVKEPEKKPRKRKGETTTSTEDTEDEL